MILKYKPESKENNYILYDQNSMSFCHMISDVIDGKDDIKTKVFYTYFHGLYTVTYVVFF